VESLYEYGMRAGLPRVLRLFQEFGWSFSTWMNARALDAAPYYGPHFVAGGHDIAAHGNRWITQTELAGPEEEARHVAQAIDRLRAATGLQNVPTGWYYGRGTLYNKHILAKVCFAASLFRRTSLTPISYTTQVHRDKGVPLLYSSDTYGELADFRMPLSRR
jgi:peptidoglycan/xylan/chitin deacetylase (PgdA/CDA1 family)